VTADRACLTRPARCRGVGLIAVGVVGPGTDSTGAAGQLVGPVVRAAAAVVLVLVQRSLLWVRAWPRLVMGCLRLAPRRAGIADEGSVL